MGQMFHPTHFFCVVSLTSTNPTTTYPKKNNTFNT